MNTLDWEAKSEGHELHARLYGDLPARRAAILVHGQKWDADGWEEVAPKFVDRGVPALAVDLRGHGRSTGKTEEYEPGQPWSPLTDLAVWKAALRAGGAAEIALVGASMGGHVVMGSSFDGDNECVVSISAPVWPMPDELSRKARGRKLYVCAEQDRSGAFQNVLASFAVLEEPKTLIAFGGDRHSRAMFFADYGDDMLEHITRFVAKGL